MENTGQLEPRVSVLDEEFNEAATLEVGTRMRARSLGMHVVGGTLAPAHVGLGFGCSRLVLKHLAGNWCKPAYPCSTALPYSRTTHTRTCACKVLTLTACLKCSVTTPPACLGHCRPWRQRQARRRRRPQRCAR